MYLQRIELQGFKSFANRTVIEFPPPQKGGGRDALRGITAIVGPNGSGKSNIVDAVRWVLGEQSLKLLRGKKATDIIFAGSSKKAQMGLAEVSLYLNNEDGAAPIDYAEVVITRKLYRDGASEYLLNKSEVRLFDIVMLLARASFGQNTYSVIGQGMVDKIVSSSGQERKDFFDEATGVKQYQIKRDRSVSKLKRSRDNLTQVQALLQELEPHLKNLTRQVERLRKRQTIETELRSLQEVYYGTLWHELTNAYNVAAARCTEQDKLKIKLEQEIEYLQRRLDELSVAASRSEEFDKLQRQHAELINQRSDILKELAVIKGRLDVAYAQAGKQNLAWLEQRKDELKRTLATTQDELKAVVTTMGTRERDIAAQEAQLHALNAELTVLQNNVQVIQEEIYSHRAGNRTPAAAESARTLMGQQSITGIYGSIGDLGAIDERYEAALAAAAGNRMWGVVVDSDTVAVACIKYLKEYRLAPVTFFPLNKISAPAGHRNDALMTSRGVVGYAMDLIRYDRKFDVIFSYVFGSTLIVETVDDAHDVGIGRERMVTLEGDVFDKNGVMRGGHTTKGWLAWLGLRTSGGTSSRTVEDVTRAKAAVDQLYQRREELTTRINELRFDLRVAQDRQVALNRVVVESEREMKKVVSELSAEDLSPAERDAHLGEIATDRDRLETQLEAISGQEQALRETIDQFNTQEEEKKREVFGIQQDMHTKQLELNRIITDLNDGKVELAKIETRREDTLTGMRQDFGEEYRPKSIAPVTDFDREESLAKIQRLKKQLELIGGTDPEIEKEYTEVKARFEFLSQQSGDLTKAITDLEKIVVELDKLIKQQFDTEFTKINRDFSRYFKQLFDGGSAKLVLAQREVTEAEVAREAVAEVGTDDEGEAVAREPVESPHIEDRSVLATMGIEIEACPPGKKIKNINILSGGEKTMTALALICAIIANNPSPFIMFDEVDAALDESNSAKLSGIVEELAHKTQFIIITHNRAIMARANILYGVTMQGDGISRLIGLKLDQAEQLAQK